MLNRAHNVLSLSPRRSLFLRILWSNPTPTHGERASWRPSKISLIFRTFAKTDLGGLQKNPNLLQLLTWRPSKQTNIHACLLKTAARKNIHSYPSATPKPAISHQKPNVFTFLSWRPSKLRNIHACFLPAKISKNTAFAPAHTTTWHPSKIPQCFAACEPHHMHQTQYPRTFHHHPRRAAPRNQKHLRTSALSHGWRNPR